MPRRNGYLHLLALCSFAIAQPVFDLLARFPQYFIARQHPDQDIFILTAALFLLPALILALIEIVTGLVDERMYRWLHRAIVVFLVAMFAMPQINLWLGDETWAAIVAAVLFGALFGVLYVQYDAPKKILSIVAVAVVIFPLYFLFSLASAGVVFTRSGEEQESPAQGRGTVESARLKHVVMVVLDELPLASLMNAGQKIDPERYPNLAKLAETSYWFRNTTTVAPSTMESIPAILTGSRPGKKRRLPTAIEFPDSLLTLLAPTHRMNIFESVTQMCPGQVCARIDGPAKERVGQLFFDIWIIYLHRVLPRGLATGLPSVADQWGNFLEDQAQESVEKSKGQVWKKHILSAWRKEDRDTAFFREFIQSIDNSEQPALNFLHVLLPHTPFRYLPSGRQYEKEIWATTDDRGMVDKRWQHEWAAAVSYQKSILQLAYVDRLLGELIARLHTLDVFSDTLIILVSDHGASYQLGRHRRILTESNYFDVLPVLLLIKLPGQQESVVSDLNVETIDILPTITDALDIGLHFAVDGQSALDASLPPRASKWALAAGGGLELNLEPIWPQMYDSLDYYQQLTGSGKDPVVIYGLGLRSDLLRRPADHCRLAGSPRYQIAVDGMDRYRNIDLTRDYLPVRVTGRVTSRNEAKLKLDIAVSINGIVEAVARTYWIEGANEFSVIVPESSLRQGANELEVFVPSRHCDL